MPPTSKDLYTKADAALIAAQNLQATLPQSESGELAMTPELQGVFDQINTKMGEYDALRVQADALSRVENADRYMDEPAAPPAGAPQWRSAGPGEGEFPVDSKSWREVKAFDAYGVERTLRFHVPEAIAKKDYASAWESYIHKGFDGVGGTDRKTLYEGTDTAGGFLVPEDFHTELVKKMAGLTSVRPLARVVTVSRDVAKWPRINFTTDDIYTSGVKLYWTGEAPSSSTVHRVTDPVFGMIEVPVRTCMASMPVSNDLLEDAAFDLLGIATDLFSESFALGEDDAFINGPASGTSGASQPEGMLAIAGATNGISTVASGTTATLTADGLINLYFAVPAQYRRNAKWLMSSDAQKVIEKLKDAQNRYLVTSLVNGSLASPQFDSIKGKPIAIDEFVPAVATDANCIIFGDFSGYLIADRVGFSIQRLTELYAETNLTLLLARRRVGGQTIEPWRLRIQNVHT